jgi:ADP-ribose pyrophosphatase
VPNTLKPLTGRATPGSADTSSDSAGDITSDATCSITSDTTSDTTSDPHLREHRTGGATLLSGGFLQVQRDHVRLPDGSHATREYIQHGGAVAVVALLDDGRLVLVRQYRYPLGQVLLELPAGKRDAGESTWFCAQRELLEETGYSAREWAYAGVLHNAAAYSTEGIWVWYARGLVAGDKRPDEGEFVETQLLAAGDLDALNAAGLLTDAKTLIGLGWLRDVQAGRRTCLWMDAKQAAASGLGGLAFNPTAKAGGVPSQQPAAPPPIINTP